MENLFGLVPADNDPQREIGMSALHFAHAKRKKRGAMELHASQWSRHCPSFGPTRLAVGLELEVFYTKCLSNERFVIRPVFRIRETVVPPRHLFVASELRQTIQFSTGGCYSPEAA
jgi:hypothetical protein